MSPSREGEVVNLRMARKRRARADKEASAQENRVRHGRTGAQKAADRAERDRQARLQDGRLLDREDDGAA